MSAMLDVAAFIQAEMVKNATGTVAKEIADHNAEALGFYDALVQWKAWVGNRKPWDHKPIVKKSFGEWSGDIPTVWEYNFDIWSNLHYGYVGRCVGFSAWTLKAGAGYAQVSAGTSPDGYISRRFGTLGDGDFLAAFDDPKDQAAIQVGIALWDAKGVGVLIGDVAKACRFVASQLNTRRIA